MKIRRNVLDEIKLEIPPLEETSEGLLKGGFSMYSDLTSYSVGGSNTNCDCGCGGANETNTNCNCNCRCPTHNQDCNCNCSTPGPTPGPTSGPTHPASATPIPKWVLGVGIPNIM